MQYWGILGPDSLPLKKRRRTLGLEAAVTAFNEKAVPGLGRVWFCKQIFLSLLGIVVAEKAKEKGSTVKNIAVANAIEALACWLALKDKERSDPRLRGSTKLRGYSEEDFSDFKKVQKAGFYVTQPMRMQSVEALRALGLVESKSARFNDYRCSKDGIDFIKQVLTNSNKSKNIINKLVSWVCGDKEDVFIINERNKTALVEILSPLTPIPFEAKSVLKSILLKNTNDPEQRRKNALKWLEKIRKDKNLSKISWKQKPACITEEHWKDLRAGALFFALRQESLEILDAIELHLGNTNEKKLDLQEELKDTVLLDRLKTLKEKAEAYKNFYQDDAVAGEFCAECLQADKKAVLKALVKRDGHGLSLKGEEIHPGPLFRSKYNIKNISRQSDFDEYNDEEDRNQVNETLWSDHISPRIESLYCLNLDINCSEARLLDNYLKK